MPLTPDEFNQIKELHEEMVKLIKSRTMNVRDVRGQARTRAKAIEDVLERLVEDDDDASEDRGFSDFFQELGDGMLETQQELDRRSSQYLQSIKGRPHLLPSVFRIPEVSGKLKVGFNRETEGKLNLIVFGRTDRSKNWTEHEVDFKINSVPPPPDAFQELEELPSSMALVLSSGERTTIFEAVASCLEDGNERGDFDPGPYATNGRDHAIRALTRSEGPDTTTLAWTTGGGTLLLVARYQLANETAMHGAWTLELAHLKEPDEGGKRSHRLTPVWRVSATQRAAEFGAVDAALRNAYEAQRRFLEGLSPDTPPDA